jgi:hypothetical protein
MGGELQTVAFTVLGIYFMFKLLLPRFIGSSGLAPCDQWGSILLRTSGRQC